MSWDNYGEWEIDHITPLRFRDGGVLPSMEETIDRLHFTNTQPLWRKDRATVRFVFKRRELFS